jgi:hypothetical protein
MTTVEKPALPARDMEARWARDLTSRTYRANGETANYPPRMIATNKETGKVAWETNLSDGQPPNRSAGALPSLRSIREPGRGRFCWRAWM